MKTIYTIILRSVQPLAIARFRQPSRVLLPTAEFAQYRRYFSAERTFGIETSEMAPKFELKTPKGTKDCEAISLYGHILNPVTQNQWVTPNDLMNLRIC